MTDLNSNISIITLNANNLKIPIKRQILEMWIKHHDSILCCLQGTHFKFKNIDCKQKNEKRYFMETIKFLKEHRNLSETKRDFTS